MGEIEYPGVYVEEVPLGVAPIAGVETSTTGFIGAVENAEPCAPMHVRSLVEFERAFGRVEAGSELGAAVARFFENGGSEAWVVGLPGGVPLSDGLECLDAVETLSLLCLPGETNIEVLSAAIEYAERRRAFALIDPSGTEVADVCAYVEALAQSRSANAAVYFPPFEGGDPPSGAVAGVYARIDRERGVWKAPAGEEASLRGEVAPAIDLSDAESSRLNSAAVNAIRRFPGKGVLVWGARTIQGAEQGGSEWKYVPVRRLGLYVEHSIDRGTQWAVCEPQRGVDVGEVATADRSLPDRALPPGSVRGPYARRVLLRPLRGRHDDPGRHRQRAAEHRDRHRTTEAGGIRDPQDRSVAGQVRSVPVADAGS